MGFRPHICDSKYEYCGTKLYGYVDNLFELPSIRYLLKEGVFTLEDVDKLNWGEWTDDYVLTHSQFVTWIALYNMEIDEDSPSLLENEDIKNLIGNDEPKIITWC